MTRTSPIVRALAVGALFFTAAVQAQVPMVDVTTFDTTALSALKWREIGPFRGGRSVAVAGSAARVGEFWMGTTGGGVFKTTDGGDYLGAGVDKYFGGTIGAIARAPSRIPTSCTWAPASSRSAATCRTATGCTRPPMAERPGRYIGLEKTRQISRVRVASDEIPTSSTWRRWVTASARVRTAASSRRTDGGMTWKKVLFRNDSTGAADLSMDPTNPDVLYAALWQAGRTPWQLVSGGRGERHLQVHRRRRDAGPRSRGNSGMPAGLIGNIGIARLGGEPEARVDDHRIAIRRAASTSPRTRGATWTRINERSEAPRSGPGTTRMIYADPKNANIFSRRNVGFYKSQRRRHDVAQLQEPHGDSHDMWIAPNDPKRHDPVERRRRHRLVQRRPDLDRCRITRRRSSIMSSTTNHFPYRSAARSRTTAPSAGRAGSPGSTRAASR